ncbi:hypothetical protein [Ancylobacter vacuolatus]|uniref:Transposase n=1 Tax=Ancylobacter vacuolatus TaxID=223389 RepID=A0ABU0DBZ4_9HYPH|nr:hypothetical protein [Ancylobacter vacuolatus]MDQ0345835.1 hypothetical protein [Ancylobacter vacuolatus]
MASAIVWARLDAEHTTRWQGKARGSWLNAHGAFIAMIDVAKDITLNATVTGLKAARARSAYPA